MIVLGCLGIVGDVAAALFRVRILLVRVRKAEAARLLNENHIGNPVLGIRSGRAMPAEESVLSEEPELEQCGPP